MPGLYVDTSALGRLILGEAESPLIRATLTSFDVWHSSELLVVELRRLAARESVEAEAERLLALFDLAPLTRGELEQASRIKPIEVRSLDAIHLTAALELHDAGRVDAVMTYDRQFQVGCEHHRIPVEAPNAG